MALRRLLVCAAAVSAATATDHLDYHSFFASTGCFWQGYDAFSKVPGVLEVRMGYFGEGSTPYPTQQQALDGVENLVEVVEVTHAFLANELLLDVWRNASVFNDPEAPACWKPAVYTSSHHERKTFTRYLKQFNLHGYVHSRTGELSPAVAPRYHCSGRYKVGPHTMKLAKISEERNSMYNRILSTVGSQRHGTLFVTFAGYDDRLALANWVAQMDHLNIDSYAIVCTDDEMAGWIKHRGTSCTHSHPEFRKPEGRLRFLHTLNELDTNVVYSEPTVVFTRNPLPLFHQYTESHGRTGAMASLLLSSGNGAGHPLEFEVATSNGIPSTDVSYWLSRRGSRYINRITADLGRRALMVKATHDKGWASLPPTMSNMLLATLLNEFGYNIKDLASGCSPGRCDGIVFQPVWDRPGKPYPEFVSQSMMLKRHAQPLEERDMPALTEYSKSRIAERAVGGGLLPKARKGQNGHALMHVGRIPTALIMRNCARPPATSFTLSKQIACVYDSVGDLQDTLPDSGMFVIGSKGRGKHKTEFLDAPAPKRKRRPSKFSDFVLPYVHQPESWKGK